MEKNFFLYKLIKFHFGSAPYVGFVKAGVFGRKIDKTVKSLQADSMMVCLVSWHLAAHSCVTVPPPILLQPATS